MSCLLSCDLTLPHLYNTLTSYTFVVQLNPHTICHYCLWIATLGERYCNMYVIDHVIQHLLCPFVVVVVVV